jgi:glycosyltransferase involved in cell wall biosynthesis
MIGQELSRSFDVPLVLEFRDRWSEDPYSPPFFWRRWRTRWVEDRLVRQASAITTVSEPWAAAYGARHAKPTLVVYNGYDAELCGEGPFDGAADQEGLEIVYTGGIYPGYRDPSPLFAAMKQLDARGVSCRMIFHGVRPAAVLPLAEAQGVSHLVEVREVLVHEEALRRQRESDVLVLLQWNDPKEQGNVPGKFFEYLGARRPVLVLGLHNGVPASIIKERKAGFFSNDPAEIANQLERWLQVKQAEGLLPPVPDTGRAGFSRDDQYARLERFLEELLSESRAG